MDKHCLYLNIRFFQMFYYALITIFKNRNEIISYLTLVSCFFMISYFVDQSIQNQLKCQFV